jgi:hypothetical protein
VFFVVKYGVPEKHRALVYQQLKYRLLQHQVTKRSTDKKIDWQKDRLAKRSTGKKIDYPKDRQAKRSIGKKDCLKTH